MSAPQELSVRVPEDIRTAYDDGRVDGFWGTPHRPGVADNLVWVWYLKGYLAGAQMRSEAEADGF